MIFKKSHLYLILLILISCASREKVNSISHKNNDYFSEESFLRFDQKRLEAHKSLAPCFSGNIIDDLQSLRDQIDQKKDDPHYWNQIGTCYFLNKDFTKAEYYYRLSLDAANKKNITYHPVLNNLGLLNVTLGHYLSARDYFRQALKNNNYNTPRYNLALVHLKYNKPEMAIKLLERFSRSKSGDPDLNFNLAYANYLMGNFQMTEHFLTLMGEHKNRSDAIYLKAIMLYDQQKYEQALNMMETSGITIKEFENSGSILKEFAQQQIDRLEELAEQEAEKNAEKKSKEKVIVEKKPKLSMN